MAKSTSSASILIRRVAPSQELLDLRNTLANLPGVHKVEVEDQRKWDDTVRMSVPTGWRYIKARGTEHAMRRVKGLVMASGLEELDQNADHDHPACIASARKMGVPESWAHRPETYLSM